ncbi:MAG TPA: PQQ-dependent sugar dehydrogenase [Allosphingosinicella sp.]|nr:PQQ-dependent sugar dehydrogenase [Allosphingosinicella sp.]
MRRHAALASLALLAACGGGGGGGAPPPPPPPAPNQAPSFTSAGAASVIENQADAYLATATDPDGNLLTFSVSGGADAARFTISATGLLRFVSPADFELPADSDGNNVYAVEITVSDGQATATLPVQISVTDESTPMRRVAAGLNQPLYVAAIPGDTRVFVLEKGGNIFLLDPATGSRTPFLSAAERLDPAGAGQLDNISTDGERGLLGLAALPDYQSTGRFVLYVTNAGGDIEIRLCRRDSNGLGAARLCQVLFTIEHSQFNNHNGGWMDFGPDGNLYIATGDGGGAGDPLGNAQNTNSLLGKILRITIVNDPFAGATPIFWAPAAGNPFLGGGGAREVFAYGLRNPFRASFWGASLLIGDVGQNAVEEIDVMPVASPGLNFGWNFREGTLPFTGTAPAGLTDPASEYLHGTGPRQGRSVIGGYVYRGAVQALQGRYFFADFVSRNVWTFPAGLLLSGQPVPSSRYERRNADLVPNAGTLNQPVSFGEDSAGNLYLVDFDGEIFLIGG